MTSKKFSAFAIGFSLVLALSGEAVVAQERPEASVGVDMVSRYVWRGINTADAPSAQPSIAFSFKGLELGTWGSYSLSNGITGADEMDFWLGDNREFEGGGSFGLLLTDYYFPNSGLAFSNFRNYDSPAGPGAHLLEVGASFGLAGAFPLSVAAYVNVYNDAGHNVYLQADYPVTMGETSVKFFVGATPGSAENPDLYGTDSFSLLNVGVTVTKDVAFSDRFALPVFGTWMVNPNLDIAYLVIGFSL